MPWGPFINNVKQVGGRFVWFCDSEYEDASKIPNLVWQQGDGGGQFRVKLHDIIYECYLSHNFISKLTWLVLGILVFTIHVALKTMLGFELYVTHLTRKNVFGMSWIFMSIKLSSRGETLVTFFTLKDLSFLVNSIDVVIKTKLASKSLGAMVTLVFDIPVFVFIMFGHSIFF